MKRILFLFAFLMLGMAIQSCKEMGPDPWEGGGGGKKDSTTNNLPAEKLIGTKWQLLSIENNETGSKQAVPSTEQYTLNFESLNNVSGMLNCNSYGGQLQIENNGYFNISNLLSTEIACEHNTLESEYQFGLTSSYQYSASSTELRIKYRPDLPASNKVGGTLVFVPFTGNIGNDSNSIRVVQMKGHLYTLYSFVNGGSEEILTDAQNCKVQFFPNANAKGGVNIQADCNNGFGDLTFSNNFNDMKISNITLTKMACPNQITANRFVDFLRNTAYYEYSDYGATLTIWSSLTTFAESKMVLKVIQEPVSDQTIDITQTPDSGVPTSNYSSLHIQDLAFDGQNIVFKYSYNGKTADYQIMAYSTFDFAKSNPMQVHVDLVTNGSMNPSSQITQGQATLLLDQIRNRILITSPGKTQMTVILRWQGIEIGQLEVTL